MVRTFDESALDFVKLMKATPVPAVGISDGLTDLHTSGEKLHRILTAHANIDADYQIWGGIHFCRAVPVHLGVCAIGSTDSS